MSRPPRPDPLGLRDLREYDLEALTGRDRWVAWAYRWSGDREEWFKMPIDPETGDAASSTDSDTWTDYETAHSIHENGEVTTDGVGYVVSESDMIVGIDLDGCYNPETDEWEDWAEEIVETVGSYTEWSPSETGNRIFALATKPGDKCKTEMERTLASMDGAAKDCELEMYDAGRYLTMTGHHVDGTPESVEQRPEAVGEVYDEYLADETDDDQQDLSDANAGGRGSRSGEPGNSDLSDEEIKERARAAENGDKFTTLFDRGSTNDYKSHSEADEALCCILAFWTGGDENQIDRLFRESALMRSKWDEDRGPDTYGEITISNAVDNCSEFYDPDSAGPKPSGDENAEHDGEEIPVPTASDHGFVVQSGCYGEYVQQGGGPDATYVFDQWTNFQLVTRSIVDADSGVHFSLTVIPADDSPAFDVTVSPGAFGDTRQFVEEIVSEGLTTTFDGGRRELNRLKEFVGSFTDVRVDGVAHKGLHGDEFVMPGGTISPDGWTESPEAVYPDQGLDGDADLSLTPDNTPEYDRENVAEMLRLLPKTRRGERFLPALAWFYAAPLRPLIYEWEGEFNLLNVLGGTGAGKTSILEVLYQMMGAGEEPVGGDEATKFTSTVRLASSNSLPVWFDEYKPADWSERKLSNFHNLLRLSTKNGTAIRGNADKTTDSYTLRAPVVISGEQRIQGAAERRRSLMTTFRRDVTESGSETRHAYNRLRGEFDLSEHALAYYSWLASLDNDELRRLWDEADEETEALLADGGIDADDLGPTPQQGIRTVVFGVTLFRAFASEMGVDDPKGSLVTEAERDEAATYAASVYLNEGSESHLGGLLGVAARAAENGYLSEDEHYGFVREGTDGEELRINVSRSFDRITKYMQDYGIGGVDIFDKSSDYSSRIEEAYESDSSYVVSHQQHTTGLSRCMGVDTAQAAEAIDDFAAARFKGADIDVDADTDAEGETALAELEAGERYDTLTVTLDGILDPAPWLEEEGWFKGEGGFSLDYRVRGGRGSANPLAGASEGDELVIRNAAVRTDDDGLRYVELDGRCDVERINARDNDQSGLPAAADGGRPDDHDDDPDGGAGTATDDGTDGETDDEGGDETGTSGEQSAAAETTDAGVPDDAEGARADAQRLAKLLSDTKKRKGRIEVIELATDRLDDTDPDRAGRLLDYAVEELGVIEQVGDDGYRADYP